MIQISELSKKIDHRQILDNINLTIPTGSIYGIVGMNGAGKTTLINHMVGAYRSDEGKVMIDGEMVYENPIIKQKLVYIPDEFPNTFGDSMKEIVQLYRSIYPSFDEERYYRLLKLFNRNENETFNRFSKGMKKQVLFILALSIMPEYLIMDEPFDGLDPHVRKVIWDILIEDVAERNMTIFISSHHLNELDNMCDHIAFLDHGQVVIENSLEELKHHYHKIQVVFENGSDFYHVEQELEVLDHTMIGKIHTLFIKSDFDQMNEYILAKDPIVYETLPLTLEEIFIFSLGGNKYGLQELFD